MECEMPVASFFRIQRLGRRRVDSHSCLVTASAQRCCRIGGLERPRQDDVGTGPENHASSGHSVRSAPEPEPTFATSAAGVNALAHERMEPIDRWLMIPPIWYCSSLQL
jgi:hypothetical protein